MNYGTCWQTVTAISLLLIIFAHLSIYPPTITHLFVHSSSHLPITPIIYLYLLPSFMYHLLDIMYPPIFPFPFFLFPFSYLSIIHPSPFPLPLHSFSFLLFYQSIHPSTHPSIFSNTIMAQSLTHPHA